MRDEEEALIATSFLVGVGGGLLAGLFIGHAVWKQAAPPAPATPPAQVPAAPTASTTTSASGAVPTFVPGA